MYVITSSIIHGADDRGMIAKDKVRMYKILLNKAIGVAPESQNDKDN